MKVTIVKHGMKMLEHITQTVMKASFVQNRKMRMATGRLFALMTLLTTVKVQMEHGEETRLIPMDTGSSIQMILLATGSVTMVK